MTDTQVTLIQIDNYGPWTVTPTPRPESDLQALQADLYADLARLVGARDGYVFFARFDNMIAVTNGVDREAHARIQETVSNRYPVTVSLSVARAPRPADALETATARLQDAGGAQDVDRRTALCGGFETGRRAPDDVQIAHFDVVDATTQYTDRLDAYAAFTRIERTHVELASYLRDAHDALAFFVGGDNFIAVCPDLDRPDYEATVEHVRDAADVDLRVGVGTGAVAAEAGMAAKHALEECRERDATILGDLPTAPER